MPRGRSRNNPVQETPPEEQALREQTPPAEPESTGTEQTVTDGGTQEAAHEEHASHEPASANEPEQAAPDEPHQEESSDTLLGYMAENFREDIREFMQNFGIGGHPPESVYSSIMGIADRVRGDQPVQSERQERAESPMEPAIPLNVRINSLEMDGDTRAFAAAEYGDLTINRIRVKQDEYGTLSVAMPKFRQTGGWKETCSFNTVEARNRLTGAVLDAYEQTLAQLQGQGQGHAEAQVPGEEQMPEQIAGPEEGPEFEEPGQGGPVMGMSQW